MHRHRDQHGNYEESSEDFIDLYAGKRILILIQKQKTKKQKQKQKNKKKQGRNTKQTTTIFM